jgi:hypothetical protein
VRLGHLAGREGWWFAFRFALSGLVPEERVEHVVLWSDGREFRALAPEEAALLAALPAREGAGQLAPTSPGAAEEQALAAAEARLRAEAERRSLSTFDASRERWDRAVEDGLAAARKAVEEARAAWERARTAARTGPADPPPQERRSLLERAEREYRRRLEQLRAAEAARYAEKDRALAEMHRRARVEVRRSLVATAYWRCA